MSANNSGNTGIRILSFDNGGPGVYSQLLILKEYMTRIANNLDIDEVALYPADYFELMGGVGFGGLVAIMLGHLRMTMDQVIDGLLAIVSAVFPFGVEEELDLDKNTKNLTQAVEKMLQAAGIPLDMKMNDTRHPSAQCKVAIYAATSANLGHPIIFRTYKSRGTRINPTITEAICATMAMPSFFSPVKIGPPMREQTYVGSAHGTNNPTREVLKEASNIFGKDARVAQVLSIGSGRTRVLSLDQSATSSAIIQLTKDMASDCELVARELSTRLFGVRAYIRLNVDRGMETVKMNEWTGLGTIGSHTSAYLESTDIDEAIEASVERIQERVGSATLGQINLSSTIKVTAKAVPAVSPFYVVLKKAWDIMTKYLIHAKNPSQKVFPITGMGGCGKTQLVSYFVRENRLLFTHVVFVDASSVSSLKTDFQVWAQSLGDGHEQDTWEDGPKFLADGAHDKRWILILDNADDPKIDLVPFFPKCYHGIILITSRNRNIGNLANTYHLELGQMETEEALSTLIRAAQRQPPIPPTELTDAYRLMEELGRLAAAVVHAGTYCRQLSSVSQGVLQSYTFTQYLALFYRERAALMMRLGPSSLDGYQHGVYTALDLSYKAIPISARDFLHLIAHFHHSDIPLSMLAIAAKESFEDPETHLPRSEEHNNVVAHLHKLLCTDGVWSETRVQDMVQTLRSFSLVETTIVNDALFLQLHPLVQSWVRDMQETNTQDYPIMATQILTSCCCDDNNRLYRYLVPHINDILQKERDHALHVNDQMAAAWVLRERGHYHDAERLISTSFHLIRSAYGEESQETLLVAGRLAQVYSKQGRWKETEALELEVLELRRRVLGTEHPATITAAANLSSTYWHQGRWNEAAELGAEVLEQQRKILGNNHLDTILTAVNLATTYCNMGRWDQAEVLGLEVLAQRRRILGTEHPDTIKAAASVAINYRNQGRWYDAEPLESEVLKQQMRLLGVEHPDTIRAAENLATTYKKQGRWLQSEKMEEEILEQRKRILGMEHPETIRAAANLATAYYERGQWEKAEKMDLEVVRQQEKVLGPEHPDTIMATANLASAYHDQGRSKEAEALNLEILERRRKAIGVEHPDTILSIANLASNYYAQGRWDEAEKLNVDALAQMRKFLGREHPDTTQVAINLAFTYIAQNRWEEAEKLLAPTVEHCIRVMRLPHPHTQDNIQQLIMVYEALGKWDKVKETEKLLLS